MTLEKVAVENELIHVFAEGRTEYTLMAFA